MSKGRLFLACVVLAMGFGGGGLAREPPIGAGMASWYGAWHEGRPMANGCPFRAAALTAASRSLPLGTLLRVTNRLNHRAVLVQITDRGPYVGGRIIDMSRASAARIGMIPAGVVPVTIEVVRLLPVHRCRYHSSAPP